MISGPNRLPFYRSPSDLYQLNSYRACVSDAGWKRRCCWHPFPISHILNDRLKGEIWAMPVLLASPTLCLLFFFCLSMTQCLSFHQYPSLLCLIPCSALLIASAPFISLCHWAMCAVPVSKTAGRPSTFPRWGMQGQRGSCESYRLGSVKILPVGKLLLPAFLFL